MGRYGQKTGAGWYKYDENRRAIFDPTVEENVRKWAAESGVKQHAISKEEIVDRLIYALVNEGARILEEGIATHTCPITTFWEMLSMCAFLFAVLYLFAQWRYKVESLSVFVFPLVFVMSLVATLGNPVGEFANPLLRTTWLTLHIVLVLLGYAALLLTAGASLLYLFQERELKHKKPRKFYYRLPALGTLDDLISRSMAVGFVLMTLAVIAASTWASIYLKTDWVAQPKIVISFFTWAVYMALVFLRTTAGWRGRKAALMTVTVLGFSALTWAAHARLGVLLIKP
jgi:ABC-type uncharacterized transport system permease subunit